MQGVMVAVTVIFYAVIAWAIVACIRAKIKMKWLWIILIILLCICITVASNGAGVVRATVSFNIYIASFSSAYYFMNGGYQLNFILPVGAVLFLALKRKLEKTIVKSLRQSSIRCLRQRRSDVKRKRMDKQNSNKPNRDYNNF